MVIQYAAYLTNGDTNDEYIIAANTAKEAKFLGTQQVQREDNKGITLEMIVGPLAGILSYPTGQVVDEQAIETSKSSSRHFIR